MLSSLETYDAIYALAAEGELQAALFGDCQPLAREAFRRSSLAGGAFPIVWFELPLFGNPRFDLHVAHGRGTIEGNPTFAPRRRQRLRRAVCLVQPRGEGRSWPGLLL